MIRAAERIYIVLASRLRRLRNGDKEGNESLIKCHSCVCDAVTVMLPAFSAGILLTLFLPPSVLVGATAAVSVAFGVICLFSK